MVHAALFVSPNSSCETACIFVCNCINVSMSYHFSKYKFLGSGFRTGEVQFQFSEFFELHLFIVVGSPSTQLAAGLRFPLKHLKHL
eukprot:COSAG02_NODE_2208_length_9500_cov_13.043400_2_plen_86_part_00